MFKLLITDLNQLNKPFIPPNLTNLFLLLNDHDMIIIIIINTDYGFINATI